MKSANIILGPEDLIIVSQLKPSSIFMTKVYEQAYFFLNPDPSVNQEHLAQYLFCPKCFDKRVAELRDVYGGWARINREETIRLIGIHNQDPKSLFIQFSLGQRYFIYQRELKTFREIVLEELFGQKDRYRVRPLNRSDEEYLITNLKFNAKAKKVLSFYPFHPRGYAISRKSSSW